MLQKCSSIRKFSKSNHRYESSYLIGQFNQQNHFVLFSEWFFDWWNALTFEMVKHSNYFANGCAYLCFSFVVSLSHYPLFPVRFWYNSSKKTKQKPTTQNQYVFFFASQTWKCSLLSAGISKPTIDNRVSVGVELSVYVFYISDRLYRFNT